jgi:hypothetical protein
MKCQIHSTEAIGVCAYCGRGLCSKCLEDRSTPKGSVACLPERLACSDECAAALMGQASALRQLLTQSRQNARASAFYCYLCGGLSAAASVVAYFMLPSPFLIMFTAGCAIALIVSGFWYGRSVRKADGANRAM